MKFAIAFLMAAGLHATTIDFNGFSTSTGPIDGLSARLIITNLTPVSPDVVKIDYTIENTSTTPITAARLVSFSLSFGTSPTAATATGMFNNTFVPGSNPNGLGDYGACASVGSTCQGGGGGGLSMGQSATGSLTLTGVDGVVTSAAVRYQAVDSPIGNGLSASGVPTTGEVPEPRGLAGIGVVLIAFGLAFRNRSRQV